MPTAVHWLSDGQATLADESIPSPIHAGFGVPGTAGLNVTSMPALLTPETDTSAVH